MKLIHIQRTGAEATAYVLVSGSDPFALGHYPGNPIYPGVLIAEHLCELGTVLCTDLGACATFAAGIKRIQYLSAVVPGDVVTLSVKVRREEGSTYEIAATAMVGNRPAVRATLQFRSGPAPELAVWLPRHTGSSQRRIEHAAVAAVLPHRYPFLLVDSIADYTPGQSITGSKNISSFLPAKLGLGTDHYPHSLIVESLGQIGIALFFLSRDDERPMDIVLGSVSEATFERRVPNDCVLSLSARIERILSNGVILSAEARCADEVVTRVGNLVAMIDPRPIAS